jgi:DNA repair protein RecO (recombination protein O)
MADRPRSVRVEAVVLHHTDWGEADRILRLYTREQGKLRAIVKGARRLRSRKAGHLEPFTRVALLLARTRDLWIITDAETVDAYLPLRDDLLLTGYAIYVIELLDRFSYEDEKNPTLYRLAIDTLQRLVEGEDSFLALRYYEIQILDLLGYRPELSQCVICGNEIKPEDQFFSASQGGVMCPHCGVETSGTRPISMPALKYMRHFQRSSYLQAKNAHIPTNQQQEMENLLQFYLTYRLERGLNTTAFLRNVRRNDS